MTATMRDSVAAEAHQKRRRRRTIQRQVTRTLFLRIPLLLYGVFVLGPIYWVVRTSFMANADAIRLPLRYLPLPFTTQAYVLALS